MSSDGGNIEPTAEADQAFHVQDERTASWVVRKIVEERAHRQRVAEWAAAETRRSERREDFLHRRYGGELADWARRQLATRHGRQRSIHLPAGRIGFRLEPPRIVVADEPKLLAWCRRHLPSALRIVESVQKAELKRHVQNTGECPGGAEIAGGGEKFYVK